MSTPGGPGTPEEQQSGVNHFAETMHRDVESMRSSSDKGPTAEFTNPGYDVPASGPYAQGPHTQGQYEQDPYAHAQYAPGPYPQAHYAPGYPQAPQYGQRSSTARGVLLGLAVACIVALAIGCVVVWKKVSDKSNESAAQATTTAQVTDTPPSVVTTTVVDPETQAATDLATTARADNDYIRSNYDNRWVAQVSAKQPGLAAEGRVWDNASIYNEYLSMKQRYPNVRLLRSSEWPVFSSGNWWVILSAQPFSTPNSALSWCAGVSLDRDHCFAKYISSTSGPEGTTLYQR